MRTRCFGDNRIRSNSKPVSRRFSGAHNMSRCFRLPLALRGCSADDPLLPLNLQARACFERPAAEELIRFTKGPSLEALRNLPLSSGVPLREAAIDLPTSRRLDLTQRLNSESTGS